MSSSSESDRGDLPDFGATPLVEVALAASFSPLADLRTSHLGLLWGRYFKEKFPHTDDQPRLEARREILDADEAEKLKYHVELSNTAPLNRVWFLDKAGDELLQIQEDYIAHNWRKQGAEPYPRYEAIRGNFHRELELLEQFVREESLGDLSYTQCEITYVSHIEPSSIWKTHGELGRVVTVFNPVYSDGFLNEPEGVQFALRYRIIDHEGNARGRLHLSLDSVHRGRDRAPIFVLRCTARGEPIGEGVKGVLEFLDLGREWAVRGFTSVTTEEMHRLWDRKDGNLVS